MHRCHQASGKIPLSDLIIPKEASVVNRRTLDSPPSLRCSKNEDKPALPSLAL